MPPKGKMVAEPTNIKSFFKGRSQRPDLFTFNQDGNAIYKPDPNGEPTKTFPLQKYTRVTKEEIDRLYTEQFNEIKTVYKRFEEAKDTLRISLSLYKETGEGASDVVDANLAVELIQKEITSLKSPCRKIQTYRNPTIRDILLENQYEKRKFKNNVAAVKGYSVLSYQSMLVPVEPEEEALEEEENRYFIVFDNPKFLKENQFPILGLYKRKEIEIYDAATKKKNKYNGLLQAILIETMKVSSKFTPEQIAELIKQNSPGSVRKLAETYGFTVGDLKDEVFELVIDAAIDNWDKETDNFMKALEETGTKEIVYVAPQAQTADNKLLGLFSTGLLTGQEATEANQENPKKWKGLNRWGMALQEARRRWLDSASGGGSRISADLSNVVTGLAAKTVEEQAAARTGAIIGHRKNH
jgi:hypothetical protein